MEYHKVGVISGKGSEPHEFSVAIRGITVADSGQLYSVGDSDVKVFNPEGELVRRWRTAKPGQCIGVDDNGEVYVGEAGRVERFNATGRLLATWKDALRLGRPTAIGFTGRDLLVADAANRCIHRYDRDGKFLNHIGKDNRMKGFLIPNGRLDFDVDGSGTIHAANPGKHRVERYTVAGELQGHFGRFDGRDPEGFPGCCNPTNVTVTEGGRIIVAEKAAPRVKIYGAAGKLLSVIPSEAFDGSCKNMDVTTDAEGRIYVVDTVRLQILVFAPVASGTVAAERSAKP